MTDSVGKTNTSRKKRAPATKKAVAKKNTTTTDSSAPKKSDDSTGIKKNVPLQPDSNTKDDLNSLNYPLHPERIWPD